MHFALRGYLFIGLIALLGVAGTWSQVPAFEGAWLLPAFLLLVGLAFEAWYLRGTRVDLRMRYDERLKLGRLVKGAFAFAHNRGREVVLQYARVLPPALKQSSDVRRVTLPPEEELLDAADILPLRLGGGRFGEVPARLLGRFALAWWSRNSAAGCSVHGRARHCAWRRAAGGGRGRRRNSAAPSRRRRRAAAVA